MRKRLAAVCGVAVLAAGGVALADSTVFHVTPATFDPANTYLVHASWEQGIGCPTNAGTSSNGANKPDGSFTDPACPTGDPRDNKNEGLLLAKTGPTANFAAAEAIIKGVEGQPITELGYDLRKPNSTADPRGSHCGAGSPRFDVTTTEGNSFFIGCNSPPPMQTSNGSQGWIRLRWSGPLLAPSGQHIKSIAIVADEGQDTGPDNFGLSVLDNIDVNGNLVGRGPRTSGDSNG